MKVLIFEGEACDGFLGGNLVLTIFQGKKVLDFVTKFLRSFEKGLADRGGWREEILPVPETQASFL